MKKDVRGNPLHAKCPISSSMIFVFFLIIAVLVIGPGVSAESLYVNSSSSSRTITAEANSHGPADGSEANIKGKFTQSLDTWTFDFDATSLPAGQLKLADIYITHRQSGFSNDSLVLEYFDGSTFIPFEIFSNVPTSLTTTGPYAASSITSASQLNSFQVRMRTVSQKSSPDNITYFVDAIELRVESDTLIGQPPVLDPIGPKSGDEGILLSFGITASDPDGTTPNLSASSLPSGASLTDNLNGTANFIWFPDFNQAGTYSITFFASDAASNIDSEVVEVTVININRPPTLDPVGSKSVGEGQLLSFTITASDPDGTSPVFSTGSLPPGASLNDNGDGSADFDWKPNFSQAGLYDVLFIAGDGMFSDSEQIQIFVSEPGNQTPELNPIGIKTNFEGVKILFEVVAIDPDGDAITLSSFPLPNGASFSDNGDGTGMFDWTPGYNQAGNYLIQFSAIDQSMAVDSEIVSFTILEGNCCPGLVGSVDCDAFSSVDIADLTMLIDHLFINFVPLCCEAAGNVDGSADGGIDIADLTFLIDHLFINFPPLSACQ